MMITQYFLDQLAMLAWKYSNFLQDGFNVAMKVILKAMLDLRLEG